MSMDAGDLVQVKILISETNEAARASIDQLPERDGAVVGAEDVERSAVFGPISRFDRFSVCHLDLMTDRIQVKSPTMQ
jgi:hypothetical protein